MNQTLAVQSPTPAPVSAGRKATSERIDYLDGWRGLAILLVLESHFLGVLPIDSGRFGVDVFFSLSGFLMSGLLFEQRQPIRKFYKRRISRIIPAFFLFVTLTYVVADRQGHTSTWLEFVSTLSFLRTYVPAHPGIWNTGLPIGHLWSLNVEEHTYIFMSVLAVIPLVRSREAAVLLFCGLSCLAVGVLYVKMGRAAPPWGFLGTEVVASHVLLAAGYRLVRERVQPLIPSWTSLATFLAAVVCYSDPAPWWSRMLLTPFLLAFTVNHLSETREWFRTLLAAAPLRLLGTWSFSVYIWQQPFYAHKSAFPGGSAAALSCAIAVGLVSFYIVENPCRRWLNRRWT